MQSGEYEDINRYGGPIEDSEPIYDRLMNKDTMTKSTSPPRAHSPSFGPRGKSEDIRYTRVNCRMKPTWGSVVPLVDQFKNHSVPDPEPMDYSVEEYSPGVQARVSSSTRISDHKSHMAAPLSEKFPGRRANTTGQRRPRIEVSSPGVNELTKRFSYGQSSPSSKTGSKIPVANTPLKATASPTEMTKTPSALPSSQTKQVNVYEVKLRNGISGKTRPLSWDFTSHMESKENDVLSQRMTLHHSRQLASIRTLFIGTQTFAQRFVVSLPLGSSPPNPAPPLRCRKHLQCPPPRTSLHLQILQNSLKAPTAHKALVLQCQ